ncbi:hypothetical protein REPUB_Repub02eG0203000 [Reevesia pubescens]
MARKNVEAMNAVLSKVWKVSSLLVTREVGEKRFLFHFNDTRDRDRVFVQQPWMFNRALLVFQELDGMKKSDELDLSRVSFWVQIHGLPLGLMNEKVGIMLEESLGDIEEVETSNGRVAWGRFLRVRVKVNVHKPFKMCGRISIAGHDKIMVYYKYERLPDLCYVCGCLDHHEMECTKVVEMRMKQGNDGTMSKAVAGVNQLCQSP